MFENILKFFKKASKKEASNTNSRDTAKERLHLVLMQDRANVSADFLDLMRQEIIEVTIPGRERGFFAKLKRIFAKK